MMVKIGVIFMPFSNPTCHFRGTADFTRSTVSTVSTSFHESEGMTVFVSIVWEQNYLLKHLIEAIKSSEKLLRIMDGKCLDGNLIISHLMPPMPFKRGPVRSLLSAVNNNTVSSLTF